MSYRISFIPKKTGSMVRNNAFRSIRDLSDRMREYIEDPPGPNPEKKLRALVKNIKYCAEEVVGKGGLRTICAPDDKTKDQQRRLLSTLEQIPAHRNAYGFVRFRDAKGCAAAHTLYWGSKATQLVVLNMDAKNFFHSVTSPHVRQALEAHGIDRKNATSIIHQCMIKADQETAEAVMLGLSNLYHTYSGPISKAVAQNFGLMGTFLTGESKTAKQLAFCLVQRFLQTGPGVTMATRFLPQGAPTSPFLSNLTMKLADIRLTAMAKKFGGFYTRYADDMTVSWQARQKGKIIDGMYRCAALVLEEYGVELNARKKRVMGTGHRQDIVGYNVNAGVPTINRKLRKRIRAAVHNELVRGSKSYREGTRPKVPGENYDSAVPYPHREATLMGYIGYIQSAHPEEAEKLFSKMRIVTNRSERSLRKFHEQATAIIQLEPTSRTRQLNTLPNTQS